MMRGTNPTHIFTLPIHVEMIKKVRIIYKQNGKILFVKENNDCTLENNTITTKLTQENTLAIDHKRPVEVQVRVLTIDDESLVSAPKVFRAGRCLEDEVI